MRYFNFIAAIILTLIYVAGKIPPSEKYNLWIITFIIPFALAANFLLLLISLVLRKKSSFYYVVTLIIASNYLLSTVGLKHIFKTKKETEGSFSVINYNTHSLGGPYTVRGFAKADSVTIAFKNWLLNNEADVMCYQEFINFSGNDDFDLVQKLKEKGYYSYFSFDSIRSYQSIVVGTLIASKFPIIKAADIISSDNGFNRITYADVQMQRDTLRIINVHLESMGLKSHHPVYTSGFQSRKEHTKIILHKLKAGVFERSNQIKTLAAFIEDSPYAVICAGDFNDLPYAYSYQFMKKRMNNTFEEVGKGFGFTYNGQTLRALRIDNQFYSKEVEAISFETFNDITFSDHFPILGRYKLESLNNVTQASPIQ
jgi:endonuclease/exonuclease/phosphatase family metal-dependent hydrolase